LTETSGAARPTACIEFENGAGLWGVARFADEAAETAWGERIRGAFRLLADTGFGGRRSSGWGQTSAPEFESGRWPNLLLPKLAGASVAAPDAGTDTGQASSFWLLSLYSPAPSDSVDWSSGDYRLTSRTGKVDSREGNGAAKKAVQMISEGSVLSVREEPVGAAVDVAPENFAHPVYRAGFALACKLPVTEQPSRWKGPVETTPQTPLSDSPEESALPEEPETLSACEPPTVALDEPARSESAGEIEIPTLSAESELDVSQQPEPPAATEETGTKPEEQIEHTAEGTKETDENTGEANDEV
jgi:hypothetical protein